MSTHPSAPAAAVIAWTLAAAAHAQPCVPAWSDQFSLGDFDSWIWDLVVHDDGSGPAVYACGNFTRAGNTFASRLARLEGTEWAPVGETFDNQVYRLASCADWPGLGPRLFAGGLFRHVGNLDVNYIAQWDGTSWTPLGAGLTSTDPPLSWVTPMLFVADAFGEGPALYAGGYFDTAGEMPALNIARWDGANWSALGGGLAGSVDALAWFDDGSGPALYATGFFADIMRWDGSTWTALDTGFDLDASAMAVHDDGSGTALFVSGSVPAEGGPVGIVVRWDGVSWAQVGATFDEGVYKLGVFDTGAGPVLGASGSFLQVGATAASHIAAWDGDAWSPLGAGIGTTAYAMVSLPGDAAMYAGGFFHTAGGADLDSCARWDGSTWSAAGNGVAGDSVFALEVFDDGSGPGLYLGGDFAGACGVGGPSIVRWDGAQGASLGGGVNGAVYALEAATDPSLGPGLYVGGSFDHAGATPAASIARWDGTAWSALAGGVNGDVRALRVFDDGIGPALYVGGDFSEAGGVVTDNVARWDGRDWTAVGTWPPDTQINTPGLPGNDAVVRVLTEFDGALYAGGLFGYSNEPLGVPRGIARLDGDQWHLVGSGITGQVTSMRVFDDGSGPALFVGGGYCVEPDEVVCDLARWDGTAWSGIDMPNTVVFAMEVYDDGTGVGPRLYAGGWLTTFADPATHHIAAWDGTSWSPLGTGVGVPNSSTTAVRAVAVFDDGLGDGAALYAGGEFETAGDLLSSNIARWGGCGNFVLGDLTGDGVVGIDDFTALLAGWGPCPDCASCPADLDGDCIVGIRDFLILLAHWS